MEKTLGVRIEDTPPYARNNVSSVWVGASLNTDGGATVSGAEITLLVRKFATEEAYIVRIWAIAALLILVVSRVILRAFVDHADEHDDCVFPTERWATAFRSIVQWLLTKLAAFYGYSLLNLGELSIEKPNNRLRHI